MLLSTFTIGVNAKTVFVAASGNNTTGDSWTNALTSIPNSGSSAIAAGDSVFVKTTGVTPFTFSQSTTNSSAFATKADVNYLGGFDGTETNSAQRAKSDLDNNGIIEPWEFTNATTLSFNSTNNAYGLYINSNTAKRIFDGFTITGTLNVGQLSGSTGGNNMVRLVNNSTFQNNTLSSCTLSAAPNTSTANMGYTKGALLYLGQGSTTTVNNTVDNCLVENNTSTITPTSSQTVDVQQSPLVHIDASNTTGRNVMSNCVIRKNQVTLDYTSFGMGTPTYNNPRGMLISISPGSTYNNCIKNLVVHNNSVTFIPKGGSGTTNLGNGGLIFAYNTALAYTDSIVNSTVANNSMMRIGYAIRGGFSNTTQPYHVISNNVLLDNKNNNGTGTITVQNLTLNQTPAGSAGTITIANNIANGGTVTTANSNNVFNNLNDLSSTNINAKGSYFTSPTAINGYSPDASVASSRWTIDNSSYLKGKGVATTNKYDKSGYRFSPTSPSVGAYEALLIVAAGSPQTISATTYLNSLTINAGGQLTLNNGVTLTVGALNLLSDATNGTGTFVDLNTNGGLTVTGTTTVNQSFQHPEGALRTWYVTPPVASASPTGMSIIKSYDELTYSWSAHTSTMVAKKGYQVVPAAAANDISFTGTLNNGNQNISLISRTGTDNKAGFNLIGNPYPSYLDWSLVTNPSNTAVMRSTTMWYRTKKLNLSSQLVYQFWTVNGDGVTSPNGASSKIPPMQAFWVRANSGGGTLALTNEMRSHAPVTDKLLKAPVSKNTANTLVRFQVSNGTNTDEAVLYFSANASNGIDAYDAPKISNDNVAIPEIYTTIGSEQIVINSMNSIPLDTPIGLGFVAGDATSFNLTANEISNLPNDLKVILKDNVTKTETDLTDGVSTYQFSQAVTSSDRFSVIFRTPGAVTGLENKQDNSIHVFCNAPQQLTVICNDNLNVGSMVSVYNSMGQKLITQQLTGPITKIRATFTKGVFVTKVNNITKKVILN